MLARIVIVATTILGVPAAASAQDYHFSTLAGLPTAGAADGTGGTAQFNYPNGGAADAAGNVYFADSLNHTIRKVTPAGVVSTVAGLAGVRGSIDGTGSAARFDAPAAVAVATDGTLYVAGNNDHTVRKITTAGVVTTIGGLAYTPGSQEEPGPTPIPPYSSRFNFPRGIAVNGNVVYVADTGNHRIRRIFSNGTTGVVGGQTGVAGSTDGTHAVSTFNAPSGIAVTPAGAVFVADGGNHTIRQIVFSGGSFNTTTIAGTAGVSGSADGIGTAATFFNPVRITLDDGGTLYVADSFNHTIRRITMPGAAVTRLAGQPGLAGYADGVSATAQFSVPNGVAVKPDGTVIYAMDSGNNLVRAITPVGTVSTLAGAVSGSVEGTGTLAKFDGPFGLGVGPTGVVYVADTGNHTVRRVTGTGVATTFAGVADVSGNADGLGPNARFNRPRGVAVATDGTIYIADRSNHTIRKITAAGVVTTLAGLSGTPGSANGTGAAALFNTPTGIAIGPSGLIFVVDAGNHTVRVVTAAGVVSTLAGTPMSSGTVDGTGAAARFSFPQGIAVNSNAIFVADTLNHTVRKITLAGVVTTVAGTPGVSGASDGNGIGGRFFQPNGIAAAADDTLFVADTMNMTIRRISPTGDVVTIGGEPGDRGSLSGVGPDASFNMPTGIALGAHGTLYIAEQGGSAIRLGIVTDTSLIDNGGFDTNSTSWLKFATPDISYIPNNVVGGVYQFSRTAPPAGTTNQAVTFQETGVPIPSGGALEIKFKLGNTDTVRKRISVIVHDSSFADLTVCTFWLPASAALQNYSMKTHTTQPWANATVSFYAASANTAGNTSAYQLDGVSLAFTLLNPDDRTTCVDPTAPTPPGGGDGPNIISNGTFSGSLSPWFLFGQINGQITSNVFEFVRPAGTPAGVVSQQTGQSLAANQIVTATFQLGNSSGVRKRVTILLHDSDFTDLSACTFYLSPGQPLQNYLYRSFTTKAWTNASLSVYPSTIGLEQWMRLGSVTLQTTPAQAIAGTECLEPDAVGSGDLMTLSSRLTRGVRGPSLAGLPAATNDRQPPEQSDGGDSTEATPDQHGEADWIPDGFERTGEPGPTGAEPSWIPAPTEAPLHTLTRSAPLDLTTLSTATLNVESWLTSSDRRATIEVSLDGASWEIARVFSPSDTWVRNAIDLSAYAGRQVFVRFVLEASSSSETDLSGVWRIGGTR